VDRVKDKVAIVTGGANGIGEATAKLLAREGASVAIVDIDDINGKKVADEIRNENGIADFWHMNVSMEEEVKQAFADIYSKYRKLNILVNNAGIASPRKAAHETSIDEWDSVMDVNLKGAFYCTKHAIPYILGTGPGIVVNVASVYGIIGFKSTRTNGNSGRNRQLHPLPRIRRVQLRNRYRACRRWRDDKYTVSRLLRWNDYYSFGRY
jgi:NAD(P)-dependent dehydrogenase (short-subunit alcohol dehydrogenase family)